MFAQSTPISYHTEAFVKSEVDCPVNAPTVPIMTPPLWKELERGCTTELPREAQYEMSLFLLFSFFGFLCLKYCL